MGLLLGFGIGALSVFTACTAAAAVTLYFLRMDGRVRKTSAERKAEKKEAEAARAEAKSTIDQWENMMAYDGTEQKTEGEENDE